MYLSWHQVILIIKKKERRHFALYWLEKKGMLEETHAVMQIHGCTGGQSTMAYVGSFDKSIHKIKYRSGRM
jgi:hypothetical protein